MNKLIVHLPPSLMKNPSVVAIKLLLVGTNFFTFRRRLCKQWQTFNKALKSILGGKTQQRSIEK